MEANQGFLTLLALLLAMGVALFEHWRLAGERRRLLRTDATDAVSMVEHLLWMLDCNPDFVADADTFEYIKAEAGRAAIFLHALATARPLSMALSTSIIEAKEVCQALSEEKSRNSRTWPSYYQGALAERVADMQLCLPFKMPKTRRQRKAEKAFQEHLRAKPAATS